MKLTNQKAIRDAFWEETGAKRSKGGHNDQCTDTRCEFCDWLDQQNREGRVSDKLAQNATL